MYIVRDIATMGSRKDEPIYLMHEWFRDGAGKLHRKWVYEQEHAQRFLLRSNAQSAATQYGGEVVEIIEGDVDEDGDEAL